MKHMKNFISVIVILFSTSCVINTNSDSIRGSGNIVADARQVSNFSKVIVNVSGQMTIEQGASESLTLEADDNIVSLIDTYVTNGKLMIESVANISPSKQMKFSLKIKNLNYIKSTGSMRIQIDELKSEKIVIKTTGSGNVNIDKIEADHLEVNTTGSADTIMAAGSLKSQLLVISGSGDIDTSNIESKDSNVLISGSGNIRLKADRSLKVNINGSGNVYYKGSPAISSRMSGSGSVNRF